MVVIDKKYPSQQSDAKIGTSKAIYFLAVAMFILSLANIAYTVVMLTTVGYSATLFAELTTTYLINSILLVITLVGSILLSLLSRGVVKSAVNKGLVVLNALVLVAVVVLIFIF